MIKRMLAAVTLCFLLLSHSALSLATAAETEATFVNPTRDPLAPSYDVAVPEELSAEQIVARSYVLTRRVPGEPLEVIGSFNRNMDMLMYPASTTKILTALIALEYAESAGISLDDTITISENARNIPGDASSVPFAALEVVSIRDALYGLLLRSGNEAANALAEFVGGDIETFVGMMNDAAAMIGCTHTFFTNPHGYHDPMHQSTAMDLARIMDAALENQTFREIIATQTYTLSATKANPARQITNINLHILPDNERYYEYSIGGKTGFHSDAGYVLVEAAEKDGIQLIAVVMYSGEYSRWPDISRLFQYGFSQFRSVTAEEIYNANPLTIQISGFSLDDPDIGALTLSLRARADTQTVRFIDTEAVVKEIMSDYSGYTNIEYTVDHRAAITQGQVMGTITFYARDGNASAVYDLIADRSIAKRASAPPTLEEIEQRVLEDPSPFPPFDWDWVLPPVAAAVTGVFVLRAGLRGLHRRLKRKKQIPKPKGRTYR